jgi:flagellar hook-basal body complex protein FliE
MAKVGELQLKAVSQLLSKQLEPNKNREGEAPEFSETLRGIIEQVDGTHKASVEATKDFIAGKNVNLHEVMALGEEAQLSFQFLMEIRNKLVEAYQEVSRMPI